VKLIREREVNHKQFSQIQALSEGVRSMFENEELRPIARLLLDPTELATGLMGFDEKRVVSAHGPFLFLFFLFFISLFIYFLIFAARPDGAGDGLIGFDEKRVVSAPGTFVKIVFVF
jgi:hypothetical protein